MKTTLLFAALLLTGTLLQAQTTKQYLIQSTGCSVKMPCNPGAFKLIERPKQEDDVDIAEEDSIVELEGKCVLGALTYGVVYNDFGEKEFEEDYTVENFLKERMAGQRDFAFDCKPSIIGVLPVQKSADGKIHSIGDEWEGYDGNWYLAKGYTDGRIIAILYVKKKGKLASTPAIKAFLDSFTFPLNK